MPPLANWRITRRRYGGPKTGGAYIKDTTDLFVQSGTRPLAGGVFVKPRVDDGPPQRRSSISRGACGKNPRCLDANPDLKATKRPCLLPEARRRYYDSCLADYRLLGEGRAIPWVGPLPYTTGGMWCTVLPTTVSDLKINRAQLHLKQLTVADAIICEPPRPQRQSLCGRQRAAIGRPP